MKTMNASMLRTSLLTLLTLLLATAAQGQQIIKYNLWVKGVQVTNQNANNILQDATASVSYTPNNSTLWLRNAKFELVTSTEEAVGITANIANLKIVLEGSNEITTNAQSGKTSSGIFVMQNTTITGAKGSELVVIANSTTGTAVGISLIKSTLTIEGGCTVEAGGKAMGIGGSGNSTDILTVNKSSVRALGNDIISIGNLQAVNTIGCAISVPAGAYYNPTVRGIVDRLGKAISREVVAIAPTYGLIVAGIPVNDDNASNILGDATGSVAYNPNANELKLRNATINIATTGDNIVGIINNIADLRIALEGTNTVNASATMSGFAAFGIFANKSTTVYGPQGSSLTVNATAIDRESAAFALWENPITIEGGCTVFATAKDYGFAGGNNKATEALTVRQSTVKAKGGKASIANLQALNTIACEITTPAGAVFNPAAKGVVDKAGSTNLLNSEVTIEPPSYSVSIAPGITHGTLTAIPNAKIAAGAEVYINNSPNDGYKLREGSLRAFKTDENSVTVPVNNSRFTMPAYNVTVTGEFEPLPAGSYAITCANTPNGSITTSPAGNATKDTEVTITATPNGGYRLKGGTLRVTKSADNNIMISVSNNKFKMPDFGVTITAEFEATGSAPDPNPNPNPNPTPDPNPDPNPVTSSQLSWKVAVDGRTLTILDAEGHPIELYNLAGVCLHRTERNTTSSLRIPLPQPGIYIVRIGNHSRKIIAL